MGLQRVRHDWATFTLIYIYVYVYIGMYVYVYIYVYVYYGHSPGRGLQHSSLHADVCFPGSSASFSWISPPAGWGLGCLLFPPCLWGILSCLWGPWGLYFGSQTETTSITTSFLDCVPTPVGNPPFPSGVYCCLFWKLQVLWKLFLCYSSALHTHPPASRSLWERSLFPVPGPLISRTIAERLLWPRADTLSQPGPVLV